MEETLDDIFFKLELEDEEYEEKTLDFTEATSKTTQDEEYEEETLDFTEATSKITSFETEYESETFSTQTDILSVICPATPPPSPTSIFSFVGNNKIESESSSEQASKKYPKKVSINLDSPKKKILRKKKTKVKETKRIKPTKIQAHPECFVYSGVDKFATHFVDSIIEKSIKNILNEDSGLVVQENEAGSEESSFFSDIVSKLRPTIREFTKEMGIEVVHNYMQHWRYKEDWLYCVNFLIEQSDECSDYYLYEAIWSIPTRPYPIPQATASVYFTIEASRVKPDTCLIDVMYNFEGCQLIHVPGEIIFQEQWLFDIIDAKIKFFRQIDF